MSTRTTHKNATPLKVVENRVWRFYQGGALLDGLAGRPATDSEFPESWVGSTTEAAGATDGEGLSQVEMPDGTTRVLRDLIAEDPVTFLGAAHHDRFGANPGLLVKLLDPAQRLPIHAHPSRDYAAAHLGSRFGKAEAWIILGTRPEESDPHVYLGLASPVDPAEYRRWVEDQETDKLLDSMHRISVRTGDVIMVQPGVPTPSAPACSSRRSRNRPTTPSCASTRGTRSRQETPTSA